MSSIGRYRYSLYRKSNGEYIVVNKFSEPIITDGVLVKRFTGFWEANEAAKILNSERETLKNNVLKNLLHNIIFVGIKDNFPIKDPIVGILNMHIPEYFNGCCINIPIKCELEFNFGDINTSPPPHSIPLFFERVIFFGRQTYILIGTRKDVEQLIKQGSITPITFFRPMGVE